MAKFDSNDNFIGLFGTQELVNAVGVAVDSSGNVYARDYNGHVCREFDSNGNLVANFGASSSLGRVTGVAIDSSDNVWVADDDASDFGSSGPGQLNAPAGVAVDSHGLIYVSDGAAGIEVFQP